MFIEKACLPDDNGVGMGWDEDEDENFLGRISNK